MLQPTPQYNGQVSPTSSAIPPLTGKALNRLKKRLSASALALLTVDISTGRQPVSDHTLTQARGLTGASVGYCATAARLTEEEREKVDAGVVTFSDLHNNRKPSAAFFDHLVTKHPQEVMAAVDRYTRPELPLFAAE